MVQNIESYFQNINIILVETSHPGNIGATARAMKTMGFQSLSLVNPKQFPHPKALEMAAGADDILVKTRVFSTLDDAIADCELVIGTSARTRAIPWPQLNPREVANKVLPVAIKTKVAIVFGREKYGLYNEELQRCHFHMTIPSNERYMSLNLAQAVQVMCYELRMMEDIQVSIPEQEWATAEEVEAFYKELEKMLIHIEFLNPKAPRQLMPRLRRLFNRARLEKMEYGILRGMLSKMMDKLSH